MTNLRVLVLLSTYNGEKYLREQLDSILTQKEVDVSILVRDDGSKDSTLNILDEYSNRYNNMLILQENNIGYIGSFTRLVLYAKEKYNVPYYAFADQDDIWRDDKLTRCIDKIKDNPTQPSMCCCNSMLIDSKNRELGILRNNSIAFKKGNSLYGCQIQGCTMTFNRAALESFACFDPITVSHDTWMFYNCMYFGSVFYLNEPLIRYRLHENNVIGSAYSNSMVNRIKKRLDNIRNNKHTYFINSAERFLNCYINVMQKKDIRRFQTFINYKHSFKKKCILIFSKDFGTVQASNMKKFLFVYHVLTNTL